LHENNGPEGTVGQKAPNLENMGFLMLLFRLNESLEKTNKILRKLR
jgi:hypothetical protein